MLQGPLHDSLGAKCRPVDAHFQPLSKGAALIETCASLQNMERLGLEHV